LSLLEPQLVGGLLAGYIFGFSAYMLQKQTCGQLSLTLAFLEPLAVLLVAQALADEIAPVRLMAAIAAVLVGEFLISVEVFAMMTVFGAMALLLGLSFVRRDMSRRIVRKLAPIAAAYAIAAVGTS
jgi:hypothetical protein